MFRRFALSMLLIAAVSPLSGCADMGLEIPAIDIPISNPFATTTDVSNVYLSQFPDVPVPSSMKSIPLNTLVTTSLDGSKVGLESFAGRVDAASLVSAMSQNLNHQGWSLRGSVSGKKNVQLFEKDQRFVIIIVNERAMNSEMEVWMLTRLDGGAMPSLLPMTQGNQGMDSMGTNSSMDSSPTGGQPYSPAPASSALEKWEGGIQSQQLAQ